MGSPSASGVNASQGGLTRLTITFPGVDFDIRTKGANEKLTTSRRRGTSFCSQTCQAFWARQGVPAVMAVTNCSARPAVLVAYFSPVPRSMLTPL